MGQAADDLIDGFACTECGVMFVSDHGFPVLCEACFSRDQKQPRKWRSDLPCAVESELG